MRHAPGLRAAAVAVAVALGGLVAASAPPARAADPVVSNVRFAQRTDGSRLVDVTYDLADADGDTCAVTLLASDDGGADWIMPCTRYTGDAGRGVVPGPDRHIVWDFGGDNADWEGNDYLVRVVASDLGTLFPPHSPRLYAINDWSPIDWTVPGQFEKYARADLVVLTANFLWGNPLNESLHVIDRIKAINPDCRVVGYVLAMSSVLAWENSGPDFPFGQTWFDRTRPYWAFTTLGDTLQNWPAQVVLDITNPACREGIARTIAEFQRSSNNKFDGVFWDYFNSVIWIAPAVDPYVDGEPDFDRDGIAMVSDPDEIATFKAAEVSLVSAVRDSVGQDFIQIFNGQRAYVDSAFAELSDGLFYEKFPEIFFPRPDDVRYALSPSYPYNLFRVMTWPRRVNGGPYNILASVTLNYYYDYTGTMVPLLLGNLFRAIGLLAGTYTAWNPYGGWTYGWTNVDISLGAPLGPPRIDGDNYSREFKYGRIDLLMDSGAHPDPFDYTIRVNGRIVEVWNRPYHLP
ncbi:MAG: alpha-amylase family protein [Candidatus Krumholzibacteriia bacterium]